MAKDRIEDRTAEALQFQEQQKIAGPHAGPIIQKALQPILNQGDVLISELEMVRWFRHDPHCTCVSVDKRCLASVFAEHARNNIFVLIQRGALEYPSMVSLLTPDKRMAESGSFELYGPFHGEDATLLR